MLFAANRQLIHHCAACWLLLTLLPTLVWSHAGDEQELQRLQQQIEQQPHHQRHYIKRGALYTRAGHYVQALADFERAQTLGPAPAVAFELGVYYYRRDQMATAATQFDRYLAHYGKVPAALQYRLKVARRLGQQQLAANLFEVLVGQSPYANPSHYLAAAKAEIDTDINQPQPLADALALIDRGISRFGPVPQLQHYAIELELQRSNYQQAISRHQTLAGPSGHSPHWQAKQAQLLIAGGRWQEAVTLAEQAQQTLSTQTRTPARARLDRALTALLATFK